MYGYKTKHYNCKWFQIDTHTVSIQDISYAPGAWGFKGVCTKRKIRSSKVPQKKIQI